VVRWRFWSFTLPWKSRFDHNCNQNSRSFRPLQESSSVLAISLLYECWQTRPSWTSWFIMIDMNQIIRICDFDYLLRLLHLSMRPCHLPQMHPAMNHWLFKLIFWLIFSTFLSFHHKMRSLLRGILKLCPKSHSRIETVLGINESSLAKRKREMKYFLSIISDGTAPIMKHSFSDWKIPEEWTGATEMSGDQKGTHNKHPDFLPANWKVYENQKIWETWHWLPRGDLPEDILTDPGDSREIRQKKISRKETE
jgi:hypothetical protein